MDRGVDFVDLLPGNAQCVRPPALGPGKPAGEAAQPLWKAARIQALADQQGGDAGRAPLQLDVVDTAAAAAFGVEDLLVEQPVRDEDRIAVVHPPPPLVINSKGTAAIARMMITTK